MKNNNSKATILVIAMGFLAIGMIFKWNWALYTSLIVGVVGLLSDFASQKIEWLWMNLSLVLSKIVPTILLGLVFYVFLFPISLISKLFSKDPLMLKNNYNSLFVNSTRADSKDHMEKIW
jgi:hypothetical protein